MKNNNNKTVSYFKRYSISHHHLEASRSDALQQKVLEKIAAAHATATAASAQLHRHRAIILITFLVSFFTALICMTISSPAHINIDVSNQSSSTLTQACSSPSSSSTSSSSSSSSSNMWSSFSRTTTTDSSHTFTTTCI